jgi:hypothetical protein
MHHLIILKFLWASIPIKLMWLEDDGYQTMPTRCGLDDSLVLPMSHVDFTSSARVATHSCEVPVTVPCQPPQHGRLSLVIDKNSRENHQGSYHESCPQIITRTDLEKGTRCRKSHRTLTALNQGCTK